MVIQKDKAASFRDVNFNILMHEMIMQMHRILLRMMLWSLNHQPTVNATPEAMLTSYIILNSKLFIFMILIPKNFSLKRKRNSFVVIAIPRIPKKKLSPIRQMSIPVLEKKAIIPPIMRSMLKMTMSQTFILIPIP